VKRSLQITFLIINLACIVVVLYAGYRVTSLMVVEQRIESDAVDGITFSAFAVPAFAVALLANTMWGVKATVDSWRRRDHQAFALLGVFVLLWLLTFFGARYLWEFSARL